MEQSNINVNNFENLLQEKENELQKVKADLKQMEVDKNYETWRASCFQNQVNFLKRQSEGLKVEYGNYIMHLMKTKEELEKITQKSIQQTYSSLKQKTLIENDKELIEKLEKYIEEKLKYINFLHMFLERNGILEQVQQEHKEFKERRKTLKNFKSSLVLDEKLEITAASNDKECHSDEDLFEAIESQDGSESLA